MHVGTHLFIIKQVRWGDIILKTRQMKFCRISCRKGTFSLTTPSSTHANLGMLLFWRFSTLLIQYILILPNPQISGFFWCGKALHEDVLCFSWALVSIFLRFREIYSVQGVFGRLVPTLTALAGLTRHESSHHVNSFLSLSFGNTSATLKGQRSQEHRPSFFRFSSAFVASFLRWSINTSKLVGAFLFQ